MTAGETEAVYLHHQGIVRAVPVKKILERKEDNRARYSDGCNVQGQPSRFPVHQEIADQQQVSRQKKIGGSEKSDHCHHPGRSRTGHEKQVLKHDLVKAVLVFQYHFVSNHPE